MIGFKKAKQFMMCLGAVVTLSACGDIGQKHLDALHEELPQSNAVLSNKAANYDGLYVTAHFMSKKEKNNQFGLSMGTTHAVVVTFTNDGQRKVWLQGQKAELVKDGMRVPAMSLASVLEANQAGMGGFNVLFVLAPQASGQLLNHKQKIAEASRTNFYRKAFNQAILLPGETVSGVLFFNAEQISTQNEVELSIPMQDDRRITLNNLTATIY